MIKRDKHIVSLLLIMFIISCPTVLFGQAFNNGVVHYNAVDSIFLDRPVWEGLKFSEKKSFLDRSYLDVGYGYNGIVNGKKDDSFHIAYSLWVAPVHGVEIEYNSFNKGRTELNYLFNLTSYAHRREEFGRFDLILKSGIAVDHDSSREIPKRIGYTTALRAQYRVSPSVYIYAEPSVSLFAGREMVAFQSGLSINLGGVVRSIRDTDHLLFALKTNLLYDLLLAPNIEIEVPIGDRWSVAGEWIFPWWVTKDNGYALQILSGQMECRYWLGDRARKQQLTGWFTGLYAGGGLYDVQWDGNGYQGEFYIAAGVSGGYAHPINKSGSLRMEYSLGLGYLSTEHRYYEGKQDNEYLVWQHDGRYTWVGPTKGKVSLVWLINWQKGGKL